MNDPRTTANFKDLVVRQKAMQVTNLVYELISSFPTGERYGLVAQMRRSAVSIPSNIAEGQARQTTGEFVQFMSIAEGSVAELETPLLLSVNLGLSNSETTVPPLALLDEIRRMLNALRRSLGTRH
ncbi:MAG TPA: four helix bundle protein [Opitutus sp.]|nr:four helix bundle protein [Opitutus sp.]